MRPRFTLWLILGLLVLSLWINLPPVPNLPSSAKLLGREYKISDRFPLKLGLDLQGGTELVLETQMDKIDPNSWDSALESAREVIERRVNLFGVSEAVVQSSRFGSSRRILVQLPGVKDTATAVALVGKTAQLEFRELIATSSGKIDLASPSAQIPTYFKPTGINGADLKKATVSFATSADTDPGPKVSIEFTNSGGQKFAEVTKRNISQPLAIFLDDQIISAPIVRAEIIGGNAVISGRFNLEQAKSLTIQLNAGALPVPIKILQQRLIGASLGQTSVQKSLLAGVIGIVTVLLFMVAYYGFYGLIADLALIMYTLIILAIFRTGLFIISPVTLTLAGISGFILSVGMAVDANILTFERIKEELRSGKDKRLALTLGFSRSWPSIRDSNISSLITATILYFFGTSVVQGFAVTLFIGVAVSMFSAIVVTRTLLRTFVRN